ncbi:RNH-1.0 protein [Aphelenchoides avenae]|nr:RNH-1.0 protein [Aphelenchus avenae]
MPFFAVAYGRQTGVYENYEEFQKQMIGFPLALGKRFSTSEEAWRFVAENKNGDNARYAASLKRSFPGAADDARPAKSAKASLDPAQFSNNIDDAHIRAGFGVYWGDGDKDNTAAPLVGPADVLHGGYQAIICATEAAVRRGARRLEICMDEQKLLQCVTEKLPKWKSRGWRHRDGRPVAHSDLLIKIDELCRQIDVKFEVTQQKWRQKIAYRLAYEGAQQSMHANNRSAITKLEPSTEPPA